jgi:ABC-type sugar transport system ATPase subunit
MICGLEEISSGELFINRVYSNELPPKDRDIAMVFQSYALYPHMSVFDNIAFGLKIKKVPVPVTKYVAVPVGPPMLVPVVTQGLAPVYPQPQPQPPIPPPQVPYPPPQYGNYNYAPPPNYYYGNNVRVIPPGYHRDYTARYSPLGNIIDDIQNLF